MLLILVSLLVAGASALQANRQIPDPNEQPPLMCVVVTQFFGDLQEQSGLDNPEDLWWGWTSGQFDKYDKDGRLSWIEFEELFKHFFGENGSAEPMFLAFDKEDKDGFVSEEEWSAWMGQLKEMCQL